MNAFLLMLVIALFWGSWQLVTKSSDVQDPYVRGFLVNLMTAAGFLPFVWGKISTSTFISRGGIILLAGGLVNFVGHALFPRLQTVSKAQISVYGAVIPALCVVMGVVGGVLFYGEPVTIPKVFCTLLIVAGIVGFAFIS